MTENGRKTRFDVSDDAREAANCPYDYQCLTGEDWEGCKVDYMVQGAGCFIFGRPKPECRQTTPFGKRQICQCPVRYEIHRRHMV